MMVGQYPALRRRRHVATAIDDAINTNNEDVGVAAAAGGNGNTEQNARRRLRAPHHQQQQQQQPKLSTLYFLFSVSLAILAIITSSPPSTSTLSSSSSLNNPLMSDGGGENNNNAPVAWMTTTTSADGNVETTTTTTTTTMQSSWWWPWNTILFGTTNQNDEQQSSSSSSSSSSLTDSNHNNHHHNNKNNIDRRSPLPPFLRWMLPPINKKQHDKANNNNNNKTPTARSRKTTMLLFQWVSQIVDPTLLHPQPSTPTVVIDKILNSTARILAICNLLLAMTCILHSIVANLFLGNGNHNNNTTTTTTTTTNSQALWQQQQQQQAGTNGGGGRATAADTIGTGTTRTTGTTVPSQSSSLTWAGRERLGGFLVFKLLLVSAVVAPDTLDLLILLSWYTTCAFLRSLSQLCATHISHASSSGTSTTGGVLYLLVLVFMTNVLAAAVCVGLFHSAGGAMVLLLTSDCILLALNIVSYVLQYALLVIEETHATHIGQLEQRQVHVHTLLSTMNMNSTSRRNAEYNDGTIRPEYDDLYDDDDDDVVERSDRMAMLQDESRQLDRRVERQESQHYRRVQVLDAIIFGLQLVVQLLTVLHFVHIWSLHGLQFTLIDGILCLHLHSALTAVCSKVAQRRNLTRIARELDGRFEDATDLDLRKAGGADNVCCICLIPMTTTTASGGGGQVKRVACGHLYHTHCLRQVVERAQSIEAAKCPLCRASLVDGRQRSGGGAGGGAGAGTTTGQENEFGGGGGGGDGAAAAAAATGRPPSPPAAVPAGGEHALFRFSTENIVPAWLPMPAFSFEVVRRPPVVPENNAAAAAAATTTTNNNNNNAAPDAATGGGADRNGNNNNNPVQPSFFRRLLIMAGAIPMSQEEVAMYVDQLVDMFPQYDRADLLRELQMRGSSEAVVEAILMGVFTGVPRGQQGAFLPAAPAVPPPQAAAAAARRDNEALLHPEANAMDMEDADDTEHEQDDDDEE